MIGRFLSLFCFDIGSPTAARGLETRDIQEKKVPKLSGLDAAAAGGGMTPLDLP